MRRKTDDLWERLRALPDPIEISLRRNKVVSERDRTLNKMINKSCNLVQCSERLIISRRDDTHRARE